MTTTRTMTRSLRRVDLIPPLLRLTLAAIGAVPVALIGASTFGLVGLKGLAVAVLLPSLVVLASILTMSEPARLLVVTAVASGALATLPYDLFRFGFLVAGWMDRDPIPHIGTGLGLEPGWLFGYLWRYLGNGGGLAVAFSALGGRGPLAGTGFGLLVCSGLLAVLAFSPNGEATLFPLGPSTLVVAVVGHVIYGAVLGHLTTIPGRRLPQRSSPGIRSGGWLRGR